MTSDQPRANPGDLPTPAQTDQACRISELSYRRLFQAAQDGILILDYASGRITDVNPFLEKLLGFTHAEMVGHTVGELSPFKDSVCNQAMLERLQRDGYVRYEDLPLTTRDSRNIAVEFVSNVYEAGGQKVIQCNVRDITARKHTEQELRYKTTLLEAQLEASIDGILVVDNQQNKVLQNRRFGELWDIPAPIMAGNDEAAQLQFAASQVKAPAAFLAKINFLYAHPELTSQDEIELLDGTLLDRYSAPVRDHAGGHHGRIWSFRDITERRKMERQLQQMQKMESMGQLAGGIAHDFNNILMALVGNLYLVKLETAALPAIQEHLESMMVATQRATDLVNQILTFSRQHKPERTPMQLNQVVLEALKLLRASLPATIRIQTELTETPTVLANATAIHQAIMNLGTNAWHAMRPRPGVLKVEMNILEADADFIQSHPELHLGRYILLAVSDTGCGMDRLTQARIFDPFFTTKGVGEGTGLGLAVVHGIMRSHEGAITVYSQPGEGTTFHLYFPVFAAEPVVLAAELPPIPRGAGEHVLFVDDEEVLARLGQRMLERLGYRVTMATNAQEAIRAVRENPQAFDLVITDLTMPLMDGASLGRELLLVQPGLAMILATGYSGLLTPGRVRELGFREMLNKPTTAQALGEAVARVLHPSGQETELGPVTRG